MKFAEAITLLYAESQKKFDDQTFWGIQCQNWKDHPTNRSITGAGMFHVHFFDFVAEVVVTSWSVYMPTWREAYELDWHTVTADYIFIKPEVEFSAAVKFKGGMDDMDYHADLFNFGHKFSREDMNQFIKKWFIDISEQDRQTVERQFEKYEALTSDLTSRIKL